MPRKKKEVVVDQPKTKEMEVMSINFPANPTKFQRVMGKLLIGMTWTKVTKTVVVDETDKSS